MRGMKFKILLPTLAGLSAIAISCAKEEVTALPSATSLKFPQDSVTVDTPISGLHLSSEVLRILAGRYEGTAVFRSPGQAEYEKFAFTLDLAGRKVRDSRGQSRNMAHLVLSAKNGTETLSFEAYLRPVRIAQINGAATYVLESTLLEVPKLSISKISVELAFAFDTRNQFDPTQSKIRIKDCGFSQLCTTVLRNVEFGADLIKR